MPYQTGESSDPIRPTLVVSPVSVHSMKQLRVFELPLGMGCESIAGLPPALNWPVPIYTPGCLERGTVKVKCLAQERNTMFPERKPGPLDLEACALTGMRPQRIHFTLYSIRTCGKRSLKVQQKHLT